MGRFPGLWRPVVLRRPAAPHTPPASSCGVQRSSRSASSSSSSPARPWPAMITPCSSIRIGLVKPNSWIEALICSSCRLGWVRALRGSGLRPPTVRYSIARASEPTAVSVMNPSGFCPLIQDIHPVMSLRSRGPAPGRNCFPTQNASNLASRSLVETWEQRQNRRKHARVSGGPFRQPDCAIPRAEPGGSPVPEPVPEIETARFQGIPIHRLNWGERLGNRPLLRGPILMGWTPPPDGIAMCQIGGVINAKWKERRPPHQY